MSGFVLDAYSLFVYLERGAGYEQMAAHLQHATQADRDLLLCTANWGEVYYGFMREAGQAKAEEVRRIIETLPIEMVDADLNLARQAAIYKATHKMSYADCFAAALAKAHRATLVTGDRDFKQLEGEIKVRWM